jgi:hypothetical protein
MFYGQPFGAVGTENLTRPKTASHFDLVRSVDLLVQFQEGGGGASLAQSEGYDIAMA